MEHPLPDLQLRPDALHLTFRDYQKGFHKDLDLLKGFLKDHPLMDKIPQGFPQAHHLEISFNPAHLKIILNLNQHSHLHCLHNFSVTLILPVY